MESELIALEEKYTRPLTMGEILEAFPNECQEFIPKRVKKLHKELQPYFDFLIKVKSSSESDEFKTFWCKVCKEIYMPKGKTEEFAKFKIMQRMMCKTTRGLSNADIQRAKDVSIWDLFSPEKRKKNVCCCPFHDDSTASFSVRGNRFLCFGCGAKGDSIDFYMKTNKVPFYQAVRELAGL